MYNFNILYNI